MSARRGASSTSRSTACLDVVGDRFRPGQQPREAARPVFGLHDQVDGGVVGRNRVVGDDDDLGGAGETGRDGHEAPPGHLALGQRDVHVAGADDHVDRRGSGRCRTPARRSPGRRRPGRPRRPRQWRRQPAWGRGPVRSTVRAAPPGRSRAHRRPGRGWRSSGPSTGTPRGRPVRSSRRGPPGRVRPTLVTPPRSWWWGGGSWPAWKLRMASAASSERGPQVGREAVERGARVRPGRRAGRRRARPRRSGRSARAAPRRPAVRRPGGSPGPRRGSASSAPAAGRGRCGRRADSSAPSPRRSSRLRGRLTMAPRRYRRPEPATSRFPPALSVRDCRADRPAAKGWAWRPRRPTRSWHPSPRSAVR